MVFRFLLPALLVSASAALGETRPSAWTEIGQIPLPSWQTSTDHTAESTYDTLVTHPGGATQTIYEHIPKGQNDDNWRKRHWVVVSTQVTKTVAAIMSSTVRRMTEDCAAGPAYSVQDQAPDTVSFLFACGKMRSDGLGRVAMIWIGKKADMMLRVSEEWRVTPASSGTAVLQALDKPAFNRAMGLIRSSRLK